ncbi:MAG TPA: hypothetical protein VG960_10570 [Caulobacteraceae bacterium]|nr:hypothetical protein [Caulobacteraceae bacterium]
MMDTIAGPTLLTAARTALCVLEIERYELLCHAAVVDEDLQPRLETLDPSAAERLTRFDNAIEDLNAAVASAERCGWRPPPSALRRWLSFLHLIWLHPLREVRVEPLPPITLRDITGRPL